MENPLEGLLSTTPRRPSIRDLLKGLKELVYTDDLVPLGRHRMPFADLADETILAFTSHVLTHPEAVGRMSIALRRYLGVLLPCPRTFVIKEAHFDVSDISGGLSDEFVGLGFEADHFAELNPREYEWCFTMKFEIPRSGTSAARVHGLDRLMMDRAKRIEHIVEAHPRCFGYLEVESYSDDNKCIYPFVDVSEEALRAFPFQEHDFEELAIPSTLDHAAALNIPLTIHKAVDVHVKIPTTFRGPEFCHSGSPQMNRLRTLFTKAGFYEIFSEAGNYIYTVQLLDVAKAKIVFRVLDRFASTHGGIIGLKLEICKYFWRKGRSDHPDRRLAPIPPITRLRADAFDRLAQSLC